MAVYNSTIIKKKKRCVSCGTMQFLFSKGRCKSCATIEDSSKRIAAHEEAEDDENLQSLIEDCDIWFSKYIRLHYASTEGLLRCYTSGQVLRWQDAQCGHYISRKHLATRWLPENCRPQSAYENCNLHGNLEVFKRKLSEEKQGLPEWLEQQSRIITKPTREELSSLLREYRYKVKILESKLKQK
jgi:hypothetical protein